MSKCGVCFLLLLSLVGIELAEAQQPPKLYRIGVLRGDSAPNPSVETFQQAMRDLGYVEGTNVVIEYRYADGKVDRLTKLTDELVRFTVARQRLDAALLSANSSFIPHARTIVSLEVNNRLPVMYSWSDFPASCGLMSYGVSLADLFRRAATYVDRILKGAKPGDLPVEQPKKYEMVINLKTAKQIGLTIPANVLARADRLIK